MMDSNNDVSNYPANGVVTRVPFYRGGNKRRSGQRYDGRHIITSYNKDELITKRQNLCFGTKLQPEWESRCLKINPVLSDDIHRFMGNEQHTQRWALAKHVFLIICSNAKRVPYIWGAVSIILNIISPVLLRKGSPKLSWYSHGAVLLTSFSISFLTSGFDAMKRFVVGKCIDFKRCHVLQTGKPRLKKVRVCDLVVGNIVKLTCDEQVPADMIILACSNPDGQVHIDTTFVDGKRDLKVKVCTKDAKVEASVHSFANIRGQIVCDRPSADLDSFVGALRLKGHPRPKNLYIHNFVMKGSIIRNTGTVYGVITHTGPDTKIAQNIKKENQCIKSGSVEGLINHFTVIVGCIYVLCLVVSMGTRWSILLASDRRKKGTALVIESLLFVLIRFFLLYGGLIPVTLPAIVDVLRYACSTIYDGHTDYSFFSDVHVRGQTLQHAPDTTTVFPVTWPMTSGLLDELGLVDIIFCDKTGTLTSNDLKASLITVGNKTFDTSGDRTSIHSKIENELEQNPRFDTLMKLMCLCNASVPVTSAPSLEIFTSPIRMTTSSSQGLKHSASGNSDISLGISNNNQYPLRPSKSRIHFGNVSYIEPLNSLNFGLKDMDSMNNSMEFGGEAAENEGDSEETYATNAFPHRPSRSNQIYYRSPHKEDECMLDICREFGYKLTHRSKSHINLEARGLQEEWNIVGFNTFSPERRRMSMVASRPDQDGSTIFVKGSADTMMNLIRLTTEDEHRDMSALSIRIEKLTTAGFRVLVCAYRDLSREETQLYQRHFTNAEDSVYSADTLHEEAAIMVERRLTYLGFVAFKDELQAGVPETLDLLMEAGIRIWMTTGDNRHAAIEAAYLSKLLVHPCRIFDCKLPTNKLDDSPHKDCGALYEAFLQQRAEKTQSEQICLVVDGKDLKDFLTNSTMQTYFVNMLCFADVVLACSLTPCQKAEFVRLVRVRLTPTPVTLAIGDGLNDVKMMQEAHVGVAVLGSTPDAAAYADFVTTHFAGLRSLLFYQGSNALQIIAIAIYWSFFKSLCLVMPIFYYQGHTDWVGLDLYGSFVQLLFHLLFTAFPVTFCALFDRPLSEPMSTNLPILYTLCRRRFHVNLLRLGFWILEGILSSIFCYLSIQTTTLESPIFSGGGTISARTFGLLCSLGTLQMSNTRLLMESFTRNNAFGIVFTLVFIFAMPPSFLGLCFLFGGRILRNATLQVALWQPVYFLIPVWLGIGAVFHVASALTQALVSPNIANYVKHWVSTQMCYCAAQSNNPSTTESSKSVGTSLPTVDGMVQNVRQVHNWCDHMLQRVRKEFNIHGMDSWIRMIPAARPFRVREGDLSVTQPVAITSSSSFSKDNIEEDLHKQQSDVNVQNQRASYLIDRFTLRFKDMQLEADYRLHKRRNHYRTNRIWYRTVFLAIGLYYIFGWILDYLIKVSYNQETAIYTILPPICVTALAFGCAILTFHPTHFMHHINKVLGALVSCMILQYVVTLSLMEPLSSLQPILFPIFTFVILHITFIYALLANAIFVVSTIRSVDKSIHTVPLFIGINVFVAFVGYRLEYNNRKNFLFEFSARNARKKQSELLNTMLPNFVVSKMINARLNEDGIPIGFEAEEHAVVSVLFCDVYHFQNLVATVEPTTLVELLDSLFLAFDRCAEQFGATKIETVFETYLAACGLSRGIAPCPYESAANAIDMALAMMEASKQIHYSYISECHDGSYMEQSESVLVKIGINSGKVISGLVGAKKPQYALFGDTVNTASRMKSMGEVGYIHITDDTYNLVKADSTLTFSHRETFVKGKGMMKTHLLISAEGSAYPNFESVDTCGTANVYRANTSDEMGSRDVPVAKIGEGIVDHERGARNKSPENNNILFECLDKSHSLNISDDICLRSSVDTAIPAVAHANDYERSCSRKLRISAAVGALTEEDDGVFLKDQPGLLRHCSMYSTGAASTNSVQSRASRCLNFLRRANTMALRHNTLSASSPIHSSSFTRQNAQDEDDEINSGIDGSDMRMKTKEWIMLKFTDKLQEDRYRSHFYHNRANINTIEQTLVIFLITFVAQSILEIAIPRSFEDDSNMERLLFIKYVQYWTVRSVYITLVFVMWLLFHFNSFSRRSESNTTMWLTFFLNLLFVSAACIFALSNSWAVAGSGVYSQYLNLWLPSDSIEFYFYIVVLHHSSGMLFQTCLLVDTLFVIISMTFISSSVVQTATTSITLCSIPCYIVFNLISAHCKEAIDRRAFHSNEKARMIEARVGQMLNDMLPKSVLEEFKSDKLKMSYCHEKMSFLFSDIVGFTLWANSVDACEVIALLQRLFARFDRNSTKFGLYKLCTIGDAYVAVSEPAIEVPSDQEAIANIEGILQMAYSMIRTIQDVREAFNIPGLNMRIGLHYGCSVGGVVGSGRLRYDLWGMDIHTANAMESNGIPGKVCVSERLKLILMTNFPNRFDFTFNNDIQVIDRCVRSYILTTDSSDSSAF
ncbi:adenylate and guanylate cyclase catalytic domain containing protein, putative [Babesia bigemina]|uniref:Adenylate and guanylate cyclase catalytic domain containing protein, putative n=1 Tax=Babesia bigemina TaxID=5866 RepID=A0A061DBC7_BABBI|nr:adenylate and guanylate cyclase catalytic domain containing protein, putative [Babesia bigemina]CDR96209.1 adenylate and guanylate cyclase catalytic domain containing protein, putative [Babesia bigemina]|eukprot:XP_012768395.1 adenylate and guanylate cyclase catalytic domain containing protein, putative [Babesia bigemina]